MNRLLKIIFLLLLTLFSIAGVSGKQRTIIDNQIFLIKEGMISKEQVFKKAKKFDDTGPHEVLLVLDATSGQNVINQVEEFNKIIPLTGLIMT